MTRRKIFLCYRREDSEAETRNLWKMLKEVGHDPFMDQPNIRPGDLWSSELEKQLNSSDAIIAVIGKEWLFCQNNKGQQRIALLDDWVNRELATALQSGKLLIPVLVNGANMPPASALPENLKRLASCQAKTVTNENWDSDVNELIARMKELLHELPKATLILTSKSPRRKELLQTIGWNENIEYFTVHASTPLKSQYPMTLEAAKKMAIRNALKKTRWASNLSTSELIPEVLSRHSWILDNTILIGVDTIVFCDGKILDRPLSGSLDNAGPVTIEQARKKAREMLSEQKGKTIHIVTGMAAARMGTQLRDGITDVNTITDVVVTKAKLRNFSDNDIDQYIASSGPLDKAGAFGLQERGVSLFDSIEGSYTNVVGLPLREFITLLKRTCDGVLEVPEIRSTLVSNEDRASLKDSGTEIANSLSIVCVGDINYDFVYDKLDPDFFSNLKAPGCKIIGEIYRGVGGTAVNFAKGSRAAGFSPCYVIGVIGGDGLGRQIDEELSELNIIPIPRHDPTVKTSIAIIVRDGAARDVSLTLTDARQLLPVSALKFARGPIEESDVFYCSGYALTDHNRHDSALKLLLAAKEANRVVVMDVVVGMGKEVPLDFLVHALGDDKGMVVDVVVAELLDIFSWFGIDAEPNNELATWERHQNALIPQMRAHFRVAILRTSTYTHEVIITPDHIVGPTELDYLKIEPEEKTGYGDLRTAKQVYQFMSPRVVLASRSPQRYELLSQVIAPSKIQIIASNCKEERVEGESPQQRVKRLSSDKAVAVYREAKFHSDVELIIGADTEIVRKDSNGDWTMIGHPSDASSALVDLENLCGKSHLAITGVTIIGTDPSILGKLKKFVFYQETEVIMINADRKQLITYVESGESIKRAGAYAIQGLGTLLVKSINGSYSNVVGLPLERLSQVLAEEFHKLIWDLDKVSNWNFPQPIPRGHDEQL